MSACSVVSTWPSCTGRAGLLNRDGRAVLELSRPGGARLEVENQLPSRNIRGRIATLASLWIGRPSSLIRILMIARALPGSGCSTSTTSPTSTPAIRTGWRSLTLFEVVKAASIS